MSQSAGNPKRILLIGGSRGIGLAAAAHLATAGHEVISVSRTPSPHGRWVKADVGTDEGIEAVLRAAADEPLDALLFLGGIWEKGAFTAEYDFFRSPRDETRAIIAINLIAPILLAQGLAEALSRSANPKIILIGSLSGLDNAASVEVANTASKFGLNGAAQALAIALKAKGVAVSIINPGNVATDEVAMDIAEGRFDEQQPIPLSDLLATIDYVLSLSAASVPAMIALAQKHGATAG